MCSGVSVIVEHIVLNSQALALPSSEKWLLCTTNPISSAANSTRKITTKYKAGMYSILAAIVVLVLSATLSDSILILPIFLIGMVAIVCTGHRAVHYYSLPKILSRSIFLRYQKLQSRRSLLPSQTTINQYQIPGCPTDIPVSKMQYLCRLIKPACVLLTGNRGTCIASASLVAVPPCLTLRTLPLLSLFNYTMRTNHK
jgi:hypothetical protein